MTDTSTEPAEERAADPCRVLLVDDHALVRTGLRAILDRIEGVEVVGEAGDGREAVELASRLDPHLVLMDLALPELNGIEATRRLARERPEIRVLALSIHTDELRVHEAIEAGAAGYLPKEADPSELPRAIEAVRRGERYISPVLSTRVMEKVAPREEDAEPQAPLEVLTPRQREVLQLVAESYTSREIAEKLDLSVKTVETHRRDIKNRLGIRDIPGLVKFAVRTGLVSVED